MSKQKKWITGLFCLTLIFSNVLPVDVQVSAAEIETGILDENENLDEESTKEVTEEIEDQEDVEQGEGGAEESGENTEDKDEKGNDEEEKEEDKSQADESNVNNGEIDTDTDEDDSMDRLPFEDEGDGTGLTVASGNIAGGTYRNIVWVIDGDGKLSVTGTGDYIYNSHENAPWKEYSDAIKSAEINISDIKYLSNMFSGCSNLTNIDFRLDSNNIEYMNGMFSGCSSLSDIDLSGLDTSNVRNMGHLFAGCSSLVELDLRNFNTSNVSGMSGMFKGCSSLVELDLSNFDTSNVRGFLQSMFDGCGSLINLNLSNFDTSNVTNMESMFCGCSSLINLDLSSFKTGNVITMHNMFYGCSSLTNIDLRNFDTGNVTSMLYMFRDCSSLIELDLSNFDTGNVTNMSDMFCGCNNLSNLNISNFDTSNVTNMSYMFLGCQSLKTLNLQNFDTHNVENMNDMFRSCINLESINLSSFSIPKVGYMAEMFRWCRNLKSLDISSFDVSSVIRIADFIDECDKLSTIHTPYNLSTSVKLPVKSGDTWYRSDGTKVTELPQNLDYSIVIGRNYIPEEDDVVDIDEEAIGKEEIALNISISRDKSGIQVIDGKTGEPVSGARVWVDGEYWTGDNGVVELSNTGLTTIQVEKEGYHNKKTKKRLEKGKVMVIVLCPDNGDIQILSASLNLTGEDEDVLDEIVCLTHKDLAQVNGIDAIFTLKVESSGKAEKFQLIQNGKTIQESPTGIFEIEGKYVNEGNGILSYYVDELSAGYKVSVRVYGTEESKTKESGGGGGGSGFGTKKVSRARSLGIRVSEESSVVLKLKELDGDGISEWGKDGKMEFGDKHTVTVPGNIPLLGDSELKFGFEEELPYTIKIENNGNSNKVKIAVNLKKDNLEDNTLDPDERWRKMKEEYDNLAKKALKASSAGEAFGANPESFGAAMASLEGSVVGYGEGYLNDSRDSLCVNVGFIIEVNGDAKATNYYFIAYIPFYVTYGVGASLTASGEIKLAYNKDYGLRCNGGSLELEPTIYGVLEGGMGADGILSIGAYGKLTFSYLHRFLDEYSRTTINGNVKIKATALAWSKVLAEADFINLTLDDSNKRLVAYDVRTGSRNMNMSGAELISMDYLSRRSRSSGISSFALNRSDNFGTTRFMSYAYENASPRLIKVGSKLHLFYLDGVEGRSAQNQTALFYQSSADNGVTWTNAVRVDNKANETADYDFDVAVNGYNIYVIWSDAGKIYGNDILSMDSEKAIATVGKEMDLMLAVINSNTGAIKTSSIATEDADMKPHVAVGNDGSVYVAWITNDAASADGLLSNENQMRICYASSTDNYAVHSIPLAKGYYPLTLDVGNVGAETCIAIDIDIDGNLDTQEDREIYTLNLNGGDNLISQTSNDIVDSVPLFGEIGGKSCLFWYQGGNIAYTADKQNIDFVFEDSDIPPMGQEFSLIEGNGGNASIVWAATSVEDAGVDLYCTDFDGNGWSNAYKLDEMESEYTAPVSGYRNGADYKMAYLGSTYEGDELYSHIYLCTPEERIATSVTFSAGGDAVPGEEYPLHLTITNNGNVSVNSLTISSADGSIQETVTGLSIAPGTMYDFTWSGIKLPAAMSEVYTCNLTVQASGEVDTDSNVFNLTAGEPDFSIETYLDYSNGNQFAGAVVSNKGILSSDVVLTIYKDENHTSQIYQTTLSEIGGGESKLAIFDLTALDKKLPAFYFTIADMNGREIYTGDNEAVLYSGKGTYLEDDSLGGNIPTPLPTAEPTAKPTVVPTALPTASPTVEPVTPTPTPGRPVSGDFPFHDVAVVPGNWKYESVKYVYENGIMNGITNPDGTIDSFQPDGSLTRAMFATVLYRMAGQPPVAYENRFSDVSTGRYYSNAIIWAYKNGIVNGYADGSYGVDDYITREQIAKMLRIYAQVRGYSTDDRADLSRFPDITEVSGWAMEHMSWAVGCGMVNGKNINGTYYLDAKGNATRAECAAMLTRFINRYGGK